MNVPRRAGKTSAALADFLVDKSEYVLGVCRQDKLAKPRKAEELAKRCGLFREAIEAAHRGTCAPALRAVADFLSNHEARGCCAMEAETGGYKNNDLFAFDYQGRLVHDIPEVQAYFSTRRHNTTDASVPCLVCGNARPPVDKHPGVKLPGGTTSGVALVSFNSNAFESYGLSRNENAPVCRECADAYTTALNRCIERDYVNPEGEVLSRRSIWIPPATVAVYWAERGDGFIDIFGSLFDQADPEAVKSLFDAPHAGRAPADLDLEARFYCLLLSGAQGRAIVRGLHTETLGAVKENVRNYFRSLEIGSDAPFPLWVLSGSICLQGKTDNLPPGLAGDFFLSILFGRPFPRTLIAAAVGRCRAERKVPPARAALLRACLIRNRSFNLEVTVSLDIENTQPAYRLGRLLAVLERLQGDAQRSLEQDYRRSLLRRGQHTAGDRISGIDPAGAASRSEGQFSGVSPSEPERSPRRDCHVPRHPISRTTGPVRPRLLPSTPGILPAQGNHDTDGNRRIRMNESPIIDKRHEIVLLFDVLHGNPNGDPMRATRRGSIRKPATASSPMCV